eukprot:XP_025983348.1 uncharacterized protein LOC113000790 isoform X3 [Glycine max]
MGSEKMEKHIKVAIFISKTSWVQRRWKKTLKLPFFTPKSLHFYLIFMSKEKVEGDTKAAIFNSKNLRFVFDFYLKQDSFLCFSIYKFVFFICFLYISFDFCFRFGSIFVYVIAC